MPQKITPGPWAMTYDKGSDRDIFTNAPGRHSRIATVWLRDVSIEEYHANARAIAIIPRMVDALRDALPILEEAEIFAWEQEGGAEVLPQANEVRAILREIDED